MLTISRTDFGWTDSLKHSS